jgi:hypothetical protein
MVPKKVILARSHTPKSPLANRPLHAYFPRKGIISFSLQNVLTCLPPPVKIHLFSVPKPKFSITKLWEGGKVVKIGEKIKRLRMQHKLTQEELADRAS